ncbi:MAG: hypothetical protein WC374_04745 [Phycisphaerae bacterium]|jgi:hypothetical protein
MKCKRCGFEMNGTSDGANYMCLFCNNELENARMSEPEKLKMENARLKGEVARLNAALKGAKAICDVATAEKKKAEAERDRAREENKRMTKEIEEEHGLGIDFYLD